MTKVEEKLEAVLREVAALREIAEKCFDQWLKDQILLQKVSEKQETLEARVTLLERGGHTDA